MTKSWIRPVLLIVVPTLACLAGLAIWLSGGRYVTTENAYVKADIAQISSEIDGRIAEVLVKDHARVKRGDVLIRLDAEPLKIALARAEAEVDGTRQNVRTMIAAWREATSELKEAQGREVFLEAQLRRNRELAKRGIVSSSKLEEAVDAQRNAKARTRVVREKVKRMLAQLGGDPTLAVDSHPMVREKIAARSEAKLNLRRGVIRSEIDGQVVNVRLQPGEHVEARQVLMAVVAAKDPWVEANFKETELTHVRPGMTATVTLDIYPGFEWSAKVASISPATGAEFALLPPQNASGNWVKVVQRLPVRVRLEPTPDAPPLRAGMTATVSVDTKRKRTLASLLGDGTAMAHAE
ncbi:MAG: HlyD family secretion protein [Pseudomonadota bacterium]